MTLAKFNNGNRALLDRSLRLPSLFNNLWDELISDENFNWVPAVNIREREEDFLIDMALPGIEKKDVKIEFDKNVLTVSGERKDEKKEENEAYTRREFTYGSFKRSFSLPEYVNGEKIAASYKDGLLTLTIPKKEEAKQKPKREIAIS